MSWSKDNIFFMQKALALAEKARGITSPDPMVGAVVVKNGVIVGQGFHAEPYSVHAEAMAIKEAGEKAFGGDIYVTLEPCLFFEGKKNPPCTNIIIKSGIKRVFAAMQDPNPEVNGKGFAEIRSAGIDLHIGLLEKEAKVINEVFIKYIQTKIPFVILKTAMSLDGKIATKTGDSFWITSDPAREEVHRIRNNVDSILVGIGTIKKDDPTLNVREISGSIRNPKKIIIDPKLTISADRKVLAFEPEKTIIVCSKEYASTSKSREIQATGAKVLGIETTNNTINMKRLSKLLGEMGITSILIEGGGNTNAQAL